MGILLFRLIRPVGPTPTFWLRHRTCFACESPRLWFFCQPLHRACVKMTSRVGKHECSYLLRTVVWAIICWYLDRRQKSGEWRGLSANESYLGVKTKYFISISVVLWQNINIFNVKLGNLLVPQMRTKANESYRFATCWVGEITV